MIFHLKQFMIQNLVKGIINYANANNYDLIVIGSHGRTGLQKHILGSVAYGVVEHAKCPCVNYKTKQIVLLFFNSHPSQKIIYENKIKIFLFQKS